MSVARHHADWLSLIEVSGPFVSLPVLLRAFPQGLDPRDPAQAKTLRDAYETWHDHPTAPGNQRAWALHVLTEVLCYPQAQLAEGQSLPAGLEALFPEHGETLRPDLALVGPVGTDTAGKAQLLIAIYPPDQALEKPVTGKLWKATPATRMMELLHAAGVPLGLLTNGEQWMLVYAPRGETTGYASWYAALWMDEPITLRAFHSLLSVRRFFGVAAENTLFAMLKDSAQDQQEVTDQLGYQVREAVEVLIQSFDALDRESQGRLLAGIPETDLYNAALTLMMRLVFLFYAEERGLLHLGKPLYDDNYAVSTLQEQLQETADRYGEEVLERRHDAWARLLATFRAVHGGIRHQDLLMQAYGGSLFDPDRYPFLEGRPAGSAWRDTPADPLAVNNRVVLHLLSALQRLRVKVPGGGPAESRRISFRALGVEQIGHVYEGLLDHTARRAAEPVLGFQGTRKKEPELPLSTLEAELAKGQDKLIEFLKDETGRSVSTLRKALEGDLSDEHKLRVACGHDDALYVRLRPFAGLIRMDSFERPLVVLPGSVYVTAGSDRRSTGTHYTPPSLTDPVVRHTLEPLVYEGPAEGWPKEQWQLRSPKEILALKVCDMAMGSGAFLVQACRYLAEKLVEAWETEEKKHPGEVLITPEGDFSSGDPAERLVPKDADERMAIARRYVADRCLYGVDINPMAVEMAKLSLWLITVDANRPFTFLDHALKSGDSLLGLWDVEQVYKFHLDAAAHVQGGLWGDHLKGIFAHAMHLRRALESFTVNDAADVEAKTQLLREADDAMAAVKIFCDELVAAAIATADGNSQRRGSMLPPAFEKHRDRIFDRFEQLSARRELDLDSAMDVMRALQDEGRALLNAGNPNPHSPRRPFHWVVEFPEVFVGADTTPVDSRLPEPFGKKMGFRAPEGDFTTGLWLRPPTPIRENFDDALEYAITIDGYEMAKARWGEEGQREAFNHWRALEEKDWQGASFEDLRLCLFIIQRQMHWDGGLSNSTEVSFVTCLKALCKAWDVEWPAHHCGPRENALAIASKNILARRSSQAVLARLGGQWTTSQSQPQAPNPQPPTPAATGFHAIVGNPPFQGGQRITGAVGTDYRNYLVDALAKGQRGSADLCAYFFLRAGGMLQGGGLFGLIATNTIAQGDTREVGLEQLAASGFNIPRAVASEKWPGVANLEVAHVWMRKGPWLGGHTLDHKPAPGITPYLAAPGSVSGTPFRLKANEGKSFQGSIILGMGFVLSPEEAAALIRKDPRNKDVLYPYLNGEDLNSRPDQSPSRWVINFHDWPLDRSAEGSWLRTQAAAEEGQKWAAKALIGYLREGRVPTDYPDPVAADYPDCLEIVRENVMPERTRVDAKGEFVLRYPLFHKWWIYGEKRPALYETIAPLKRILSIPRVSKFLTVSFVPKGIVPSEATVVIASGKVQVLAASQCTIHEAWTQQLQSSLETRGRYTPSDCFETFPFPEGLLERGAAAYPALEEIGARYHALRQEIMRTRNEGLTATYNRFHNPQDTAPDIAALRQLHTEMDRAVADAYGWHDLDLGHGFHPTKQGLRYTLHPNARREVLDRLLALNHQRYAEELAAGLHDKGTKKKPTTSPKAKPTKKKKADEPQQELF